MPPIRPRSAWSTLRESLIRASPSGVAPTGHAGMPAYGLLRAFWSRFSGAPWYASGDMAQINWLGGVDRVAVQLDHAVWIHFSGLLGTDKR